MTIKYFHANPFQPQILIDVMWKKSHFIFIFFIYPYYYIQI